MKPQTIAKSYHYFDTLNFQQYIIVVLNDLNKPSKKIEKKKVPEDVQAHISVDIHIGNEAAGSKLDL